MSRLELRSHFLASQSLAAAPISLLAGDASFRKYWRISTANNSLVLMDAPPEHEDVHPFIQVAALLKEAGVRVPDILAANEEHGFLLLEDLGDDSFSRVLSANKTQEQECYHAAVDALVQLRHASAQAMQHFPLKPYDEAVYLREAALLAEWFMPQHAGLEAARRWREEYLGIWKQILRENLLAQSVIVHRDYHADNLLWLPQAQGIQRVAMLDFQDALAGDAAYDMVSLLEDARRDVAEATVASALARYCSATGEKQEDFLRRYALLGAQRNCKIIGIFTRLAVRDNKPHYLALLPRVWAHLARDLAHPALAALRQLLDVSIAEQARGVLHADVSVGGLAA